VQFLVPDDGRKDHAKYVKRFTRINNLRNRCNLLVVLQEYFLCMFWHSFTIFREKNMPVFLKVKLACVCRNMLEKLSNVYTD